jgi:hypothetical protein
MQKIEAVTSHVPDTTTRIARRMEIGTMIHQGDIYVCRVADDHPHGEPWGSRQVAVGQQIGARHVATGDSIEVFAGVDAKAQLPLFTDEQRRECRGPVVVAKEQWTLTHPEHAHHVLPAGTYQVTYQWDETTMQRVVD